MPIRSKAPTVGWIAFCQFGDGTKGFSPMMLAEDEKDFIKELNAHEWTVKPTRYLRYFRLHSSASWINSASVNCARSQIRGKSGAKENQTRTARKNRTIPARQRSKNRSKIQRSNQ